MIVGAHRLDDETLRLQEYSPGFGPQRFAAHEQFFVEELRRWVSSRFGVVLPAERTAMFGVSAGGELALALGLRHPDLYGAVFCASPGGGYRPPGVMPSPLPRAYLVAGTLEPFFLENANRWAVALSDAGADVVMAERVGSHGDAFWERRVPADGGVGLWTLRIGGSGMACPSVRECPLTRPARSGSCTRRSASRRILRAADSSSRCPERFVRRRRLRSNARLRRRSARRARDAPFRWASRSMTPRP
jgi:pimeloyl-ACP methyl ester carboxylesterase